MKKRVLIFTTVLGMTYLGITSYQDGPAKAGLNRTGAAGTIASCANGGCHTGAGTPLAGAIAIRDKASSSIVTDGKYIPLKTYVVTLACNTASMGLPKFGFQAAVTKADNSSTGTLTATAANTIVRTVSGVKIIEHTTPIGTLVTGHYSVEFEWTAPDKGAGNITFYSVGNAVNMDGSTSGDQPSNGITATYAESGTSGISAVPDAIQAKIYPNPCTVMLNIESAHAGSKDYSITIADLTGRRVLSTITQGSVDVSALTPGVYLLQINNGMIQQSATFVKQ